jgi:molybdate transport system substrate-binding protein
MSTTPISLRQLVVVSPSEGFMKSVKQLVHLLAALIVAASSPGQTPKREVTVAAAANLSEVFQVVGTQFESATGIHPTFSFASTAQLAQQIENGAPYDVYAAADVEHVDQLEKKGLLLPRSRAVYATGILALWIPPGSTAKVDGPEGLVQPSVKVIALAKPELAPYGLAARETLQKLGIWDRVQSKVVYADNINMAKQYGASGNADAVFTAYSLVLKEAGKVIKVDEKLHNPIDQALGIVAASKHLDTAQQFVDFLLKGRGRGIMGDSGYRLPAAK